LADFNEKATFSTDIPNIFNINFKENQPIWSGLLFHASRRKNRYVEANSRFSQLC